MNKLLTLLSVVLTLTLAASPLEKKANRGHEMVNAAFDVAWQNVAHHWPEVAQASTTTTTTG